MATRQTQTGNSLTSVPTPQNPDTKEKSKKTLTAAVLGGVAVLAAAAATSLPGGVPKTESYPSQADRDKAEQTIDQYKAAGYTQEVIIPEGGTASEAANQVAPELMQGNNQALAQAEIQDIESQAVGGGFLQANQKVTVAVPQPDADGNFKLNPNIIAQPKQ